MPPKRKHRRYLPVLEQENFKKSEGGVYAYMAFDQLDQKGYGLFKIGMAISLTERIDGYHSYFPTGVYISCILSKIPVYPGATKAHQYKAAETFIHDYLENKTPGVKRIHSTTRSNKMNPEGLGKTDWFYATYLDIENAFVKAQEIFGGNIYVRHLNEVNKDYKKAIAKKPIFVGKIVYNL